MSSPDLDEISLFIRGFDEECDDEFFYHQFDSPKKAVEACKKIKKCIDCINGEEKRKSSVERII